MASTIMTLFSLILLTTCAAHPLGSGKHADEHVRNFALRDWAHPDDHPAVALFRRAGTTISGNGSAPAIGSSAWVAQYPSDSKPLDPTQMPQAWKDALQAAESAGLIPNLTLSEPTEGRYPSGINAGGAEYCNAATGCRADGDIWDAPNGTIGISFDDGPTTNSPPLYDFLQSQNQSATHFYIGQNIMYNPKIFLQAFNNGDAIACHTWTHPFMTSRTNAQLVAEFGWTLQIISDLSGGRVPKYWRPPYGDSDNRVRAVARHIFGLTQVDWNHDTEDWQLPENSGVTQASIAKNMAKWLSGPKSPGLIILEHELYAGTVQAFISAYPSMKANGWDTRSIPDLFDDNRFYQNAQDDTSAVTPMNFTNGGSTSINLSTTSQASSGSSSSASSETTTAVQHSNVAAPRFDHPWAPLLMATTALLAFIS